MGTTDVDITLTPSEFGFQFSLVANVKKWLKASTVKQPFLVACHLTASSLFLYGFASSSASKNIFL